MLPAWRRDGACRALTWLPPLPPKLLTRQPAGVAPADALWCLPLAQYRGAASVPGITIFYSTTCTLYGVTIRQSPLTAVVDYYGYGGHTYQ